MRLILILVLVNSVLGYLNETTVYQLPNFKAKNPHPVGWLTTSSGWPVELRDTAAINTNLINNEFFTESTLKLNRERIPARIVHAKGAGAFGHFQVTHDITDICKAELFDQIGKITPLVIRFSNVFIEQGGADSTRETRGMAIKFYTQEGNLDLVNLDVEMFIMKDPMLFPTFVHSFNRNPVTHMRPDANSIWDFLTSRPETLHMMTRVFGDRGIPDGYRYMPSFPIHTFQVYNKKGKSSYIRFHVLPDAGIRNLTSAEGTRLAGEDPDYAIKDLYDAIAEGNYPTWTIYIQVATIHDVLHSKYDLFDITKIWNLDEYPLMPVGRIVLDRNPTNYFKDVEQLGFNPGHLVPGILGGVDKVFEARRLSYRDALDYRLGKNFNNIEVNCPYRTKVLTYNRDGRAPVKDNFDGIPNYLTNSFNGPIPYVDNNRPKLTEAYTDPRPNNFDQIRDLYISMSNGEKSRLVTTIVNGITNAEDFIKERAIKLYTIIHEDLGSRISAGLRETLSNGKGHQIIRLINEHKG